LRDRRQRRRELGHDLGLAVEDVQPLAVAVRNLNRREVSQERRVEAVGLPGEEADGEDAAVLRPDACSRAEDAERDCEGADECERTPEQDHLSRANAVSSWRAEFSSSPGTEELNAVYVTPGLRKIIGRSASAI